MFFFFQIYITHFSARRISQVYCLFSFLGTFFDVIVNENKKEYILYANEKPYNNNILFKKKIEITSIEVQTHDFYGS